MSLTSKEMKQLEQEGAQFRENDITFLAQAQKALDMHGDPVDLLELFKVMWNDKRPHEREALDRIGCWLEGRLSREFGVGRARLLLELGWLKRLARIHGPAPKDRDGAQGAKGAAFGRSLADLRRRRQQVLIAHASRPVLPPARTASNTDEQTWEGATLRWNPGSKELTVQWQGKSATARLGLAEKALEALPAERRKAFLSKKELRGVTVYVRAEGNSFRIVRLEMKGMTP